MSESGYIGMTKIALVEFLMAGMLMIPEGQRCSCPLNMNTSATKRDSNSDTNSSIKTTSMSEDIEQCRSSREDIHNLTGTQSINNALKDEKNMENAQCWCDCTHSTTPVAHVALCLILSISTCTCTCKISS